MADSAAVKRQEPLDAAGIRGICEKCGRAVVSECRYVSGVGYFIEWRCVGVHDNPPTCDYISRL